MTTYNFFIHRFIVMMDRTIFAEIPWEKRVEYLELLLHAWTTQREENALLEIIHSTRSIAELEAIFALLRERGNKVDPFVKTGGRAVLRATLLL